jgi:hypothetical protein
MRNERFVPLYVELKNLRQEGIFLDFIEGAMTCLGVPTDRRAGWSNEFHSYHAKDHERTLVKLRELFEPLIGHRLVLVGPLALPFGAGWFEHQAEYGPHGVAGKLVAVEGAVLDFEGAGVSSHPRRRPKWPQHFRYCLVLAAGRSDISEEPYGIWWQDHPAQIDRVLVPIRDLGSGWWHEIVKEEGGDDRDL